jgi:hypothetical protein
LSIHPDRKGRARKCVIYSLVSLSRFSTLMPWVIYRWRAGGRAPVRPSRAGGSSLSPMMMKTLRENHVASPSRRKRVQVRRIGGCFTRFWTSAAGVENLKTMGESFCRVRERMWSHSSGGRPLKGWLEGFGDVSAVRGMRWSGYLQFVQWEPSTYFRFDVCLRRERTLGKRRAPNSGDVDDDTTLSETWSTVLLGHCGRYLIVHPHLTPPIRLVAWQHGHSHHLSIIYHDQRTKHLDH